MNLKKHQYCKDCGYTGMGIMAFDSGFSCCLFCMESRRKKIDSNYNIFQSFEDRDHEEIKHAYEDAASFQRTSSCATYRKKIYEIEHEFAYTNMSVEPALENKKKNVLQPKEVQSFIKKYIIGQDEAIREISIAISQHTKRMLAPSVDKSNILLLGPSGSGKTHMFRSIANLLKVPFSIVNATEYTGAGFVGQDVSEILSNLYFTANKDAYLAQKGIVLIDEFDKLSAKEGENINTTRVQEELLKMIEGSVVTVNVGTRNNPQEIDIDTRGILFVCTGAFQGLQEIVEEKENKAKRSIGLGSIQKDLGNDSSDWQTRVSTEHLETYGIMKEILGRLPVITYTKDLTVEELKKIMTEPQGSLIQQQKTLLAVDEIDAEFTEEFVSSVANEAFTQKIGARGLKRILSKKLKDLYFNVGDLYFGQKILIDENKIHISPNLIKKQLAYK